jgi:hypothetical protein
LKADIAAKFNSAGQGIMVGCVGALDGIALKINRPRPSEAGDPKEYFNRKGYYALVVQAICDHERRFMFAAATEPGATHDSKAFKHTSLYEVDEIFVHSLTNKLAYVRLCWLVGSLWDTGLRAMMRMSSPTFC